MHRTGLSWGRSGTKHRPRHARSAGPSLTHKASSRYIRALLGAIVLAASFVAIVTPSGPAAAVTPTCTSPAGVIGGFEIDGNMTPGDCNANLDWGNAPGVVSSADIGTYNTNNKDDSNPSTWTSGGGTPDKGDFSRAYSFAQTVGTDYFVYAAWERTNTGTAGYIIEVDNAGVNNVVIGGVTVPQPVRSQGGFVFYITTQGAAAPVVGQVCHFTSQATYPGTCTTNMGGNYATAINDAPIFDPLNGGASVPPASSWRSASMSPRSLESIRAAPRRPLRVCTCGPTPAASTPSQRST